MGDELKNAKEVIKFIVEFGEGFDKALADKKLSFTDAYHFIGAVKAAPAAFEGIGEAYDVLKTLTTEQKAELVAYAAYEFDIANDKIEEVIEQAVKTVLELYTLAIKIKKLRKG